MTGEYNQPTPYNDAVPYNEIAGTASISNATYGELFSAGTSGIYGDYGLGTCASAVDYSTAYIDQNGSDQYQIGTDAHCLVNVTAPFANGSSTGTYFAFWPTGTSNLHDASIISEWVNETDDVGRGHFHRMVITPATSRATGVAVIREPVGGDLSRFVAYLFDSDQSPALEQIGSPVSLSGLGDGSGGYDPLPWVFRTRLIGQTLDIKAWPTVIAEPAWGDAAYTFSWTVPTVLSGPFQTSAAGLSGWLASGMPPGANTKWNLLAITAEVETAVSTGQRGSFTATDLLNLVEGVGQISSTFRFEVVDKSLGYLFSVYPPKNASMSIRVDTDATVKRTLDGFKLTPFDALRIDPFQHRLRVIFRLETGDEWPLGVFLFDDKNLEHNSRGTGFSSSLTDQTTIIDQPRITDRNIPQGASIWDAVVELLHEFDVKFDIPSRSGVTAGTPITYKAGDSAYAMLADLFTRLQWYPPYFDRDGILRGRPVPAPANSAGAHRYSTGNLTIASGVEGKVDLVPSRIFDDSLTETDDLVTAPNRYVVVSPRTNGAAAQGIYEVPADAPHSRNRRGFYVNDFETVNGLDSDDQAFSLALNKALHDIRANLSFEFSANPDPRHDIYDRVVFNGLTCIETSHTLTLMPQGPHQHKIRRLWADASA